MKLSALTIQNFKGIGDSITILIDNIVVLIGPNNSCKSTVLDAYEAYASAGSALSLDYFHDRKSDKPIEITGVFTELSENDIKKLGQEWLIKGDAEFGDCAKFKFVWREENKAGEKYSFSNIKDDFVKGGAGGWDTILQSCIPTPIRVNPTDSFDELEKVVKSLAASSAVKQLKDKSKLSRIVAEIEKLAKEVEAEISKDVSPINTKIQAELEKLFKDSKVVFETGVGKFKAEDAIKDGSKFYIETNGSNSSLEHQGTGVRRAFLWSAISALCSESKLKKGRTAIKASEPKVLLLDEPEINLHPSLVKAARKAIYSLADMAGWQIICTTHSPIFIDLTKNHTTLIKVSNSQDGVYYFQTDKANFTADDISNLKMLNLCCPTVNEFFFYDNSLLVEGDTEYLAYQYLIEENNLSGSYCVINCRGKANIATFIKIFNQFGAPAIAIHDLDSKLNKKNDNKNPAWKVNLNIRNEADATDGRVKTLVHVPDFEGHYFDEMPTKDKPYRLFQHLQSDDFRTATKYQMFRDSFAEMIKGTHKGFYTTVEELDKLAD
ncbi:ATP-dependent endonuclease [Vibrio owensii]|uniref:ATP-dependent nuclease n=1 Tax=Vibrio owensii TaxID=696485 RepID=UPI0022DE66BD|nr:AAA family ATPase [Vibrio owensii]MDA0385063.1 AAA family ATPase [Vibrio owensii]CAH1590031.1 Endonuclease [Vibrio owensii]